MLCVELTVYDVLLVKLPGLQARCIKKYPYKRCKGIKLWISVKNINFVVYKYNNIRKNDIIFFLALVYCNDVIMVSQFYVIYQKLLGIEILLFLTDIFSSRKRYNFILLHMMDVFTKDEVVYLVWKPLNCKKSVPEVTKRYKIGQNIQISVYFKQCFVL